MGRCADLAVVGGGGKKVSTVLIFLVPLMDGCTFVPQLKQPAAAILYDVFFLVIIEARIALLPPAFVMLCLLSKLLVVELARDAAFKT